MKISEGFERVKTMKRTYKPALLLVVLAMLSPAAPGMIYIGNPGNAADTTTGRGAVDYDYYIAPYAVSNAQWVQFDPDHNPTFSGNSTPVQNISWYEAAQYCNWRTSGNAFSGAYLFDQGGNFLDINRDQALLDFGRAFVLPTEDEWYKAAFYNTNTESYQLYATPENTAPIAGTESNYAQTPTYTGPWNVGSGVKELNGTYNMMGNVWEWTESFVPGSGDRVLRGGAYNIPNAAYLSALQGPYETVPHGNFKDTGFRVVMLVPEPTSLLLLIAGGAALSCRKRSIR